MDGTIILLFAAVLIVGGILFAIITLSRNGGRALDVNKYRCKWLEIETQLKRDDSGSHTLTILNADKLLDQALRECGVKGETMGERMKNAKQIWTNANTVWQAHKVRNQIAHESDFRPGFDTARRALSGFKQGLKDIGAI